MNEKKFVNSLLMVFLLPLAFFSVAEAETRLVWSFDWEGFDFEVYAPYQAYPGDTITIGVRTEAKKDLRDVYVEIRLYGSKLDGYDTWTDNITVLYDVELFTDVVLDQNFNVSVPSDVSPGLIYGHTYCNWKVGKNYRSLDDSFTVTYLENEAYEDLQVAYSALLNDYNTLLANYSDLLDYYNSLSADYVSLNSTYYDLLGTYDQLQSDYESLQENSDTLNSNYVSLNSTHHTLLDAYNQLQSDYNSLQENNNTNYNALQGDYNALNSKYSDLRSKHETLKTNLGIAWVLGYISTLTTIILIAVYLAERIIRAPIRKTKGKTESKTT